MAQTSSSNEFEGSIDFLGRPSMSRASSSIDFYNFMHAPSNFHSPAPTGYSTDECMTPEYSFSDCDFESYQSSIKAKSRRKNHFLPSEKGNVQPRLGLDSLGPTSAYTGCEPMGYSPAKSRSTADVPLTPASSTEGQMCRDNPAASSTSQQSGFESCPAAHPDNENSGPGSAAKPSKKKRKSPTASKAEKPKVPKLDRPLSELTKDISGLPVRDMEKWVHRSIEERRREVEKRDGHVARPMNSFMLYRSAFAERTKQWCLQNNHQVVSSVSGASWPLEPAWIREKYNELARIERINHQAAHPGYKFSPSKNQPPPPRRRKASPDEGDEVDPYLSEIEEYQDLELEPIQIPQVTTRKRKQRPQPTDAKKTYHIPDGMAMADQPAIIQREEPIDMNSLRLQTGAQKSAYETVNPGRPAPVSMANNDIDGTYYQMSVRPMPSANTGSSLIEDVTIRRTVAPTAATGIIHLETEEVRKKDTFLQYQQNPQAPMYFPLEPHFLGKQEPSMAEQDFTFPPQEAPPDEHKTPSGVNFEQYRELLEQQAVQNVVARQAYIMDHGDVMMAPYQFVSPGLLYLGSSGGFELGDKSQGAAGMMAYGDMGGPLWNSLGEGSSVMHPDTTNYLHYEEWLTE
ncbi:hypothetical protein TWF730_008167 [Orbilia blumenaviensis]|uniref:HMG box domain-containing protein n=1 Tax=Orbilia blumenaviensis TaxID=1796055 RepID=A0AAV9V4P4_9PEZI